MSMQPLIKGQPGQDESWEELAEHSLTHDDMPRAADDAPPAAAEK
jgi:hypothetical protein